MKSDNLSHRVGGRNVRSALRHGKKKSRPYDGDRGSWRGAGRARFCCPERRTPGLRELIFQDASVKSPADAGFPERFQSLSLEKLGFASLEEPHTVLNLSDPRALEVPADLRAYLRGLGVKTLLLLPLHSHGHVNGVLSFQFAEERDFQPEELEIARALATQAILAIHLTELAKSAKQSAVLEERNRLAGEIHDSLAQCFTGITMQLGMAKEVMPYRHGAEIRCSRFFLKSPFFLDCMCVTVSAMLPNLPQLAERLHYFPLKRAI